MLVYPQKKRFDLMSSEYGFHDTTDAARNAALDDLP